MKTIEIVAADGTPQAATLHAGQGARARAAVLIAPAMGVRQDYYADFAAWLARQGYTALTFDYRGIGAALFGYFPGARLRKVGDLPRGVIRQWRRWCLHPHYHVGAEGAALRAQFAEARFPVVALSITDDELMTERGTRVLIDCCENAPRELQRIAPADAHAQRIGHFGFFRPQFETMLWTRVTGLFQRFAIGAAA